MFTFSCDPGGAAIRLFYQIMEQRALRKVNNCFNTQKYLLLSDIWLSNFKPHLTAAPFTKLLEIRHLWQLNMAIFLHRSLICAVLLGCQSMFIDDTSNN
jgi:hypothetical protein